MQPIKVWQAPPGSGPNPWKVIMVLEELNLPYEIVWIPYSSIKSEPFLSLNPNGRLPAAADPDTGVSLFESGAIVTYLVDTYDNEQTTLTYGAERPADRWHRSVTARPATRKTRELRDEYAHYEGYGAGGGREAA
ncbi:thioredoxin-like protein [Camillea tinctor]|nr:thioredoxin-like protein [Camillea tinctor]